MIPFWRKEPLDEKELKLWSEVMRAHHFSTFRNNPSAVVIAQAAAGSQDYLRALSAGLNCFGGPHGPIPQTVSLLSQPDPAGMAVQMLELKMKVPGWGSSFTEARDPIWEKVRNLLAEHWTDANLKLEQVTHVLHSAGKNIYPNPSAYTATTAIVLGIPAPLSPMILVAGRLMAWSDLIYRQL